MTDQPDPTAGHSPLPWEYETHIGVQVYGADDARIHLNYEPNVALIVREVNEAPKLRAEVERLREALETWRSWCDLMDGVSVTMNAPQGLLFTAAVERSIAALNPQEPADD